MWNNSLLLPTMVCVIQHLEGSLRPLYALLNYSIVEIKKSRRGTSTKTNTCKKLLITNVTIHLACGHRWLQVIVSLRRNKEKRLDQPSWLQTFRNNFGISVSRRPKCLIFFFFFFFGGSLDSYFWSNWIKYDELETSNFIPVWKRRRWEVIST